MSYIENFKNKFPGICFHRPYPSYDLEPLQRITRKFHGEAHDNFDRANKTLIEADRLAYEADSHEAVAVKEQVEALVENAWKNVLKTNDNLLPVDKENHQLSEDSPLRRI